MVIDNPQTLFYIVMIIVATIIGCYKNRPLLGFFLGFFLSLIGVIIIGLLDSKN